MSQTFISSQPPLMVFIVCLAAFGFTMIVLAYIIGDQEVPNPDVKMDWNKFFKRISDLKLCPSKNYSRFDESIWPGSHLHHESALNSSTRGVVDESKSMSAVLSDVVDSTVGKDLPQTAFVEKSMKVIFELQGKNKHGKHFHIKDKIKGKFLGLPGKFAHLIFNVSLSFRSLENSSCDENTCHYSYEVCIYMLLPLDILPKTKDPEVCKIESSSLQEVAPILFSEVPILDPMDSTTTCLDLDYSPDSRLTEMLSPQDRSIVNLHLMHTSYFMFVMVMTLVCYSLIRSRFRQPKNYFFQRIPQEA